VVCAALLLMACASAQPVAVAEEPVWVGAWATSQQIPEPRNALPADALTDATLRQTVQVTRGGEALRVRVSNAFGTEPLTIRAAHIARAAEAGSDEIVDGSDVALSFNGAASVVIPAGAAYLSDAVAAPVAAFDDFSISLYYGGAPSQQTSHPGSRTTSHYLKGDHVSALSLPGAEPVEHWYQIAGIDVLGAAGSGAIAIVGDSITDGRGSTTNGNDRWPDLLARRLQASADTAHLGVLNHGIGGNRLLDDGLGPNALARFERDVLAQPGVRFLIVYEGVNDLGTKGREEGVSAADFQAHAERMIGVYDQMITRAHAHGIYVIGATILPYGGGTIYPVTPESEAARQAVNDWIRNSGRFDAVADFDAALRNPTNPLELMEAYDTGDRLHPSVAGFHLMAGAFALDWFAR
jgi:lysophospholipase L1-like esterase